MSLLSPRLQLKVAQKQILTPGLVQMVTVLQLNRLELKEMITQEIVKNPVLEEATEEPGEEVTPEELLPLLEAEAETVTDPADKQILEAAVLNDANSLDGSVGDVAINGNLFPDAEETAGQWRNRSRGFAAAEPETPAATDPFDEIDFGSFFDDYLDPGYKKPRLGIGGKTFVRDLPFRTSHAGRPLALAIERQLDSRRGPQRRRVHHWQPGRRRLPLHVSGGDRFGRRAPPGGRGPSFECGAGA